MPDILLVQPPIRDFYLTTKRTIPYGLSCIAANLRKAGFSVEIFDGLATTKARPIETPRELNYLNEFYGQPDYAPFALFSRYKHFGYSFEFIGQVAKKSNAFLIGISSLFTPSFRCINSDQSVTLIVYGFLSFSCMLLATLSNIR